MQTVHSPLKAYSEQLDQLLLEASRLVKESPNEDLERSLEYLTSVQASIQLAAFYYQEACTCFDNGALFAATIMGSAMLEALLFARTILERDKVESLPKFRMHYGNKKNGFRAFLDNANLSRMMEVARELRWLDREKIPTLFEKWVVQSLPVERALELRELLASITDLPEWALQHALRYRNMQHVAVCVKAETKLENESGTVSAFFLILALSMFPDISGGILADE